MIFMKINSAQCIHFSTYRWRLEWSASSVKEHRNLCLTNLLCQSICNNITTFIGLQSADMTLTAQTQQVNCRQQNSPQVCNYYWVLVGRYFSAVCRLLGLQLRAIGSLCESTSSTRPEVHNLSQRRQSRTEPRPQKTCIKNVPYVSPCGFWVMWADRQPSNVDQF